MDLRGFARICADLYGFSRLGVLGSFYSQSKPIRLRSGQASLRTGFIIEICLRPPGSLVLPTYDKADWLNFVRKRWSLIFGCFWGKFG